MGRLAGRELIPATDLLRQEHRKIRHLIASARRDAAGRRAAGARRDLREQIHVHLGLEEELFYPAVKQEPSREAEDSLDALLEGHLELQTLADGLLEEHRGRRRTALLERLQWVFERHIHDCEKGLFDEARLLRRGRLAGLGAEMKLRLDIGTRRAQGE